MARHEHLVDIRRIGGGARIAGEGGGHPEGLAPHLAAALAELLHGLHGLEGGVDLAARVEIIAGGRTERPHGRSGVARPDRAFELRHEKALEILASFHPALLAIGLETEGVRIAPRRKGTVGEVQQREEPGIVHTGWLVAVGGSGGGAASLPPRSGWTWPSTGLGPCSCAWSAPSGGKTADERFQATPSRARRWVTPGSSGKR